MSPLPSATKVHERPAPKIVSQEQRPKKRWWLALGGGTLWLSILVHFLFAAVATYVVVEHFSKKRHVNFQAAPATPPSQAEHKVQIQKKSSVDSAPPDLKRITTTDISPITLPEVPDVPPPDTEPNPSEAAANGEMGEGLGSGVGGNGSGSGGGVTFNPFGSTTGQPDSLKGYFFDTKQTPDGKQTDMDKQTWAGLGVEFTRRWHDDDLSKFFRSPTPLETTSLAISPRNSGDAPAAFNLGDNVLGGLWFIHYSGTVVAPTSGRFRFVGYGDNILVVRINGSIVLDAGQTPATDMSSLHEKFPNIWMAADREVAELRIGKYFDVDEGQPNSIDILIGDDGGLCAFFLLIQQEGVNYEATPDGTPKLSLFQINSDVMPDFGDAEHPPMMDKVIPWKGVQASATPDQ